MICIIYTKKTTCCYLQHLDKINGGGAMIKAICYFSAGGDNARSRQGPKCSLVTKDLFQ